MNRIIAGTKQGIKVFRMEDGHKLEEESNLTPDFYRCLTIKQTPDNRYLAAYIIDKRTIALHGFEADGDITSTISSRFQFTMETADIVKVSLSPCGSYLSVLQYIENQIIHNFTVYHVPTFQKVLSSKQSVVDTDVAWPIHFSADESWSAIQQGRHVCLYRPTKEGTFKESGFIQVLTPKQKVRPLTLSLSPPPTGPAPNRPRVVLAVGVPARGKQKGELRFYHPRKAAESKGIEAEIMFGRAFANADRYTVHWSPCGLGAVVRVAGQVDHTQRGGYYGHSLIVFCDIEGRMIHPIPCGDGYVYDIKFAPLTPGAESRFAVIAGAMPPKVSLFAIRPSPVGSRCDLLSDLGSLHVNVLQWSPLGRMLLLIGQAGMSGTYNVIETKPGTSYTRVIGSGRLLDVTEVSFSPDESTLMVAATRPRFTVDNYIKLALTNAEVKSELCFGELWDAQWLPTTLTQAPLPAVRKEKQDARKYVPPSQRKKQAAAASSITTTVQEINSSAAFGSITLPDSAMPVPGKRRRRRRRK